MTHPWVEKYLLLCLEIDAALARRGIGPFLDCYYGPGELKARAQSASPEPLDAYMGRTVGLLDELHGQKFEQQRTVYLEKQLTAVHASLRLFSGEEMSLEQAAVACLDVALAPKPESDLQEALRLYEQALPGKGSLAERYDEWYRRSTLPEDRAEEAGALMRRILEEARRRANMLAPLPEGEGLDIHVVRDVPYGAANWYQGAYRSRLELNAGRPVNLMGLHYQMCHEVYPGHHTEYALKEAHLYRELGREEMCAFITLSPQLVVSEGLAALALEIIFTPEEAARWAEENLFAPLGIDTGDVDLPALYRAFALSRPDDFSGNLILLSEQGYSDEQLVEYAMSFRLVPEALVRAFVQTVHDPVKRIYNLSYYQGVRLIQPLLQGEGKVEAVRRILTDQVYPTMLARGLLP